MENSKNQTKIINGNSTNSKMEALIDFLKKRRVRKGSQSKEPFTHSTKPIDNFLPSGNYYIPTEFLEDFYIIYCNAASVSKNRLSVTETPGLYGPLRADFDFKADLELGLKRQYNEAILKHIVRIYQEEIKKCIDPDEFHKKMLYCIVLEKEKPRSEQGVVKDGFHLHFPFFICENRLADHFLKNEVTKKMIEEGIWNGTKYKTSIEDIIDKDISSKQWMMYGSMNEKTKYSTPYSYNRKQSVFGEDRKDPWKDAEKEWGHVYDENLKEISMYSIFEQEMRDRKKSVRYYLPRFLSIKNYYEGTKLNEKIRAKICSSSFRKNKRKKPVSKVRSIEEVLKDIKTIKDGNIMEMISIDRADTYNEWMDLGWTLFNIGQGHEEMLELWIEFSQKSPKFKPGECEELWERMEMRGKTIGSLLAMAKTDEPDLYKEWKSHNVYGYMRKSLREPKPTEYDVSLVFCEMFKDRFLCADSKKNLWYEFRDHRWREIDDSISIKKLLVEDIIEKYYELMSVITQNATEDRDIQIKKCMAMISKLKTVQFRDKVVESCKLNMYDPSFLGKIDENRYLVGCENGVLDLKLSIFREGRPDDYITLSTGIHYREYREDDDEVEEFNDYILKVFPNNNLRKYFIDVTTSCLQGGNANKLFMVCTGIGDNGKSITIMLMEKTFGEYFGKFPRALLMKGRGVGQSSGQRSDLIQIKGKRIMSTQELTDQDNIDIGVLKELTGNDSFFARGAYEKKGKKLKPMFTFWMQCNAPPRIPGNDAATWNRVRELDFESVFVKPADLKNNPVPDNFKKQLKEKKFKADTNLIDKLEDLSGVLLWKLFRNFRNYEKSGLIEPKEVTISTDEYKSRNDIYLEFLKEKVETIDEEDLEKSKENFISLTEMYTEFKAWYIENYPSYKKDMVNKMKVRDEINKKLGVIKTDKHKYGFGKKSRYYGYRFIQDENDESEDVRKLLGTTHRE